MGEALKNLRWLGAGSQALAVVDQDVWRRWWRARPVEILDLERAMAAGRMRAR